MTDLDVVEICAGAGGQALGGLKRCPFPGPRRRLYRLYSPVSFLQAWLEEYSGRVGHGTTERVRA